MKRIYLLLVLFFLFILPIPALAVNNYVSDKQIQLGKNEVVNENYFASGDTVTLSGTVNGDVYVAGGTVFIDGIVNGDVLAAGGTVRISGTVKNDVRVAGGTISITGPIGGNVTAGGGTVEIADSAKINGSLVAGAGTLSIFGPIGKGATIGGGTVVLDTIIGGNIISGVGQLTISPHAKINGDLSYWSEQKAQIANEASISGNTYYHITERRQENIPSKEIGKVASGLGFTFKLFESIAVFIIGALLIRFAPRFTKRVVDKSITKPWSRLGIGFVGIIVTPVLAILLFVTLIGIPLAFLVFVLYGLLLYIAKIFTTLLIGQKLFDLLKQTGNMYAILFVGLVAGTILGVIPIIGWVMLLIVYLTALGGLLVEKKELYTSLSTKELI